MQSHIDQQILLEVGDGSQKKHFIIQFINCALRQTVYLCEKASFLKPAGFYCSIFIIFCMATSPACGRISRFLVIDLSGIFIFQPYSPPVLQSRVCFVLQLFSFSPPQSFLSNNSKHDSGFWERRWVHCVRHRLYGLNVYILSSRKRGGGCARLSSSSGRLKNVRRGQQNSKVDPR